MADSEKKTYQGNCHCGRYRFELCTAEIKDAISCSCSLCQKKDYLWIVPNEGEFRVVRDDGRVTEYSSASLKDTFCNQCGTGVVGEHIAGPMKGQFAVNIRAIRDINPFQLEPTTKQVHVDEPKRLLAPLPEPAESDPPAYEVATCHCQKVRAELLVPLREGQEVKEDNCSSCQRMAYVGVYPKKEQVRVHGRPESFEYLSGRKFVGICFCRTCGVGVYGNVYGPDISIFDKLPPERKEVALAVYRKNIDMLPLNVRAMDGVDVKAITWIVRSDEGTDGYTPETDLEG